MASHDNERQVAYMKSDYNIYLHVHFRKTFLHVHACIQMIVYICACRNLNAYFLTDSNRIATIKILLRTTYYTSNQGVLSLSNIR